MRNRLLWSGGALAAFVLLTAAFGPIVVGRDPTAQDILARTRPPSAQHPFGTDRLGRDVFARVVYGARIALLTGGVVAAASLAAGLVIGTATAYYGGRVDTLLMRAIDVFMSFPGILVAISVMAVLGQGLRNMILALALVQIPRLSGWCARPPCRCANATSCRPCAQWAPATATSCGGTSCPTASLR